MPAKFRRLPITDLLLLKMNPVVKFLIITNIVASAASGLLAPIFAIFITDFIIGGGPAVAGVAAAIFLLTKSLAQIPVGALIDKICGDKDDFWFLIGGMAIINILPLAYLFIETPIQLFAVQFILGLATAFTFPSFMALFSRYIEKSQEGAVWGVYFTLVDLASAATAAIGGVLATTIGFEKVIYAVTIIGFISTLLHIPIRSELRKAPCD